MSKQIGILTHYYQSKNIGGLLQAYALPAVLTKLGYLAEQLSFDYTFCTDSVKKKHLVFLVESITLKKLVCKIIRVVSTFLCKDIRPAPLSCVQPQSAIAAEFEQFIAHSAHIYNSTNVAQANADYDIFITGSDQVFASYLLPFSAYYGEFTTPDKKVISYAASSDRKKFAPLAEKLFIQKLARLNAISVREKTLKEYIERITPYKATVVLDPTFLLSPQEWLKIANPTTLPQKPYIFCYFLGGKSAWQRKIAQAYADRYGYEVVHLPYIMGTLRLADQFLKGQGRYDVGPREFIALINGAQCVFTDSFHGLAFSINFGKNFYVFNRDDQAGPLSMNARITDTLATFGLTARHITDKNAVLDNIPLDFTHAHQVLAREKELSINWLLSALK